MTELNVDCLILIFNKLIDKKSLHSCLLVNKKWCNIVVPILWKGHSWNINKNALEKKLFNTILSCLSSSSKQILSDNGIKLPSTILLKPPSFDYISLCKFPDIEVIKKIIEMVLGNLNINNYKKFYKKNLLEQEIYKLFISQCKNIKELRWITSQPLSLFSGASTCFSQLYSLFIDIDLLNSNHDALFEMAKFCKNLNLLFIQNCSQDYPGLISLIDAQINLKTVYFCTIKYCRKLGQALEKKGNTVNYLHLSVNNTSSISFITSFVNLTYLSIYNSYNGYYNVINKNIQQYLSISEFPKLQHLRISHLDCFEEISQLIEKTKGNILKIYIYIYNCRNDFDDDIENTGMLIKSISNNCPKIKFLHTYIEPKDFIHVKSLLLKCNNLEEIRFGNLNSSSSGSLGDELLNILKSFSPNSLINISISGDWKYNNDILEKFFLNHRERPLIHFNFDIVSYKHQHYITDEHKKIIRKYIDEGVIAQSTIFSY